MDISWGVALSAHFLAGEFNPVHPFVRYEDAPFVAGAFLNSESNLSFAAGVSFGEPCWTEVGLSTGYAAAPVLPFVRFGCQVSEKAHLVAFPAYNVTTNQVGAVFALELRF